jgi:hypothetical protein
MPGTAFDGGHMTRRPMQTTLLIIPVLLLAMNVFAMAQAPFPPVSQLPARAEFPDPLLTLAGKRVETAEQWLRERRPELKALFQHYMYGYFPEPPVTRFSIDHQNPELFQGAATLRLITISLGNGQTPQLHLMLVLPNRVNGPAPVFLGLNFCGNHALLDDPAVPLPQAWVPSNCPGCQENRATDHGRGQQKDVWDLEESIKQGYALATMYCGDIDPDKPDFSDGVHPHFRPAAPSRSDAARGPHDWATIAAWAWGLHRAVDYLVTDPRVDKTRIAVVGHSRLGKTALLAGAFDERIALVMPHQAGCGGTAPSRHKIGETVKQINDHFPHWFCDEFKRFNDDVERLPFDQHCLVALCAPRPVLLTNALEDSWADPGGQFQVLRAAEPVYRLLNAGGLGTNDFPEQGKIAGGTLAYFIRAGKHSMTPEDWKVFRAFAKARFRLP